MDWVPEQSYEDSIGQDLVDLLVVPNTIIIIIIILYLEISGEKGDTCGI